MNGHSFKKSLFNVAYFEAERRVCIYMYIYIYIPLYHPWTIHKPPSEKRKRGKAGDVEHGRKSFLPKSIAPSLESVRANSARIG